MKESKWKIQFGASLIFLSLVMYVVHYLIFHDAHHIFVFMIEDIAFIPIEVLIVSLILHKILEEREKQKILEKLNMLIGIFFNEVGTKVLNMFAMSDPKTQNICSIFYNIDNWNIEDFDNRAKLAKEHQCKIDIEKMNIKELSTFLKAKRNFLMGMLQNPSLLEHETFTELLTAVFHLEDELHYHINYDNLTQDDVKHLEKDIERVYPLLIYEWIIYMKYLKNNYPYLLSLAIRNNPFINKCNG